MRGKKIVGLLLIVATLIFVLACLMFYNTNQSYEAEKGIKEAIMAYSAAMEEADIKVLTREVNEAVEKKLKEMNTDELSQKDLEELLETVLQELEIRTLGYRDTDITQEELNNIANEVIKRVIELKIGSETEEEKAKLEAYRIQLDKITQLQQNIDAKIIQAETNISGLQKDVNQLKAEYQKEMNQLKTELQNRIGELEKRAAQLEGNLLYYQYDEATNTLKLTGKKGE